MKRRTVNAGMVILAFFMCLSRAPGQEAASNQEVSVQETGTVTGTAYDGMTGNALRGVTIEVVGNRAFSAVTDLDGKYVLKLPAGPYQLRAVLDSYFDQPIKDVVVKARETIYIDPVLVSKSVVSTQITVTADTMGSATVKAAQLERKSATVIMDNISAEDISKNGDGNVAAVLERVTGISVVEDKFVFVRGLGERYSNTMLNGSVLPSTEPERKVVPLDLFPSALIDKVTTLKNFTPDQPGDFSGGLVKIETMEFPAEGMIRYSTGIGFDTNVSTRSFLTYQGSSKDWLGAGAADRRLPADFPSERIARYNPITGTGMTPDVLQQLGRELKNQWQPREGHAIPNLSHSITAGGTFGKLGVISSLTYGRKFGRLKEELRSYQALGDTLLPYNNFTNDKNTNNVKIGFVGNLAYKFSQNNKLQFKNMVTRDGSDEARILEGYSRANTADELDYRLRYVEENIYTGQLSGEHYLPFLHNSQLEWRMAYARATREEPDLRENIYRSEQGLDQYTWSSQGQSGYRQYSDQRDRIYEPAVDWTNLFMGSNISATVKVGALYHYRTRDFSSRRLIFQAAGRNLDFTLPPEELFAPENIRPDALELREVTRATDTYDAEHRITAGYGMVDLMLHGRLRLVGGARVERSLQHLTTYDPFAPKLTPIVTDLDNTDILPAVSATYALKPAMNLRGGYSRTLNRPEFREMAPFQFTDISGRSTIFGNPNLQRAMVDNFDARWEWFPSGTDLYAASFFWKKFDRPIERVLQWSADLITSFYNTQSARNLGVELELRRSLGFVSSRLEDWNIYTNYSRIHSEVEIGEIPGVVLTSLTRPLQGQAKNLFNAVLEANLNRSYTNVRVLYNYTGERISDVGATGLPDIYEQPLHFLDLSVGQRLPKWEKVQLKINIQNLLGRDITHLQGGEVYYKYRPGRVFSLGLGFDIY